MAHTDSIPSGKKTYRSPQRILVRFFEKSRDQWKVKCLETKATLHRIKNRATWLEHSRDQWKARAQALTRRVKEVEVHTATQDRAIEALKKNQSPQPPPQMP